MSIEKRVADAVLQKKQHITLKGMKFDCEQPTIATLIRISELVAELPTTEENNPFAILKDIKNCKIIGDIIAVLVCGVKKRKWYDFTHKRRQKKISAFVVDNCTPADLSACLADILRAMQLADFFAFTASLKGLNLLREADKTTTVSGQWSQE